MGTTETHKGFDLVRLKGNLARARVNIEAALPAVVHAHQIAQRSQDAGLEDKLLSVITGLRHIQTTLEQAARNPPGDTGDPR